MWRLIVLAILILLFRRMPIILALYKWIPDIKTFREAIFVGWFGPMGVGAIFISTLARVNIPEPEHDGDTSQVDLLQETIGPIVAMLVLSSVLTHGLSIPFLLSGRRVRSITYTWSRNPSMDTRAGNEPAWTTHTTRMEPGQQVIINRDDEEGDVGLAHNLRNRNIRVATEDGFKSEGSGESTSSRTREGSDGKKRSNDESEEIELERRGTPPLAAYRQGDDLVVERKKSNDDVSFQVLPQADETRSKSVLSRTCTNARGPLPTMSSARFLLLLLVVALPLPAVIRPTRRRRGPPVGARATRQTRTLEMSTRPTLVQTTRTMATAM